MNEFNPRIEVHNGEGLTITVRPDREKFVTTDLKENEIELKFGNEDIDSNNEVKWKDQSKGKSEISDDVFMRSKQPILLSPIDGEVDWLGGIRYKPNIGNIAVAGSILKIQISETNDFKNPCEKTLNNNGNDFKIDFKELKDRFGFGTRVYMRLSNLLPNDYEIASTVTTVSLYDSFNVRLVDTPLDSTGTWMGEVEYEYSITDELKQYTTVSIEVSDNVDFTDCYSEEVNDERNHSLNYNKLIEKFGYGANVYIRTKITSLSVSKTSSIANVQIMNVIITITNPQNGEQNWLGTVAFSTNLTRQQLNFIDSFTIETSRSSSFTSIVHTKTIPNTLSQSKFTVDEVMSIGFGTNLYIRVKAETNGNFYYSTTYSIRTYCNATITIDSLETDSGMWIGGINYTLNTIDAIKNNGTLSVICCNTSSFSTSTLHKEEISKTTSNHTIDFSTLANTFGIDSESENTVIYVVIELRLSNGIIFRSNIVNKKLYNGNTPVIICATETTGNWNGTVNYNFSNNVVTKSILNYIIIFDDNNSFKNDKIESSGIVDLNITELVNYYGLIKNAYITVASYFNGKLIKVNKSQVNYNFFKNITLYCTGYLGAYYGYNIKVTLTYKITCDNRVSGYVNKNKAYFLQAWRYSDGVFINEDRVFPHTSSNGTDTCGGGIWSACGNYNVQGILSLPEGRVFSNKMHLEDRNTGGVGN